MNRRYIFTGGPGAGKTTLLDLLREKDFTCVPEVAREIIKERLAKGLAPRPEPMQFARDILTEDIAQYDNTELGTQPIFFDRGIGDALYQLHECGKIQLDQITRYLSERPYNKKVFIFPPWPEIFVPDAERDQAYEEAVRVYQGLWDWYKQFNYTLVQVPVGEPVQRLEFIMNSL